MEQNQRTSIMQMAQGAFQERVDFEIKRVVDNILDPNTKPTAKRKITLTIEMTPDDERRVIDISVVANLRLRRQTRSKRRFALQAATKTVRW